jgi:hypothetical protein
MDEEERSTIRMTPDFGTVSFRGTDGRLEKSFFVRGVIPIPIRDSDQEFCWGVWTTLSEKNYHRFVDLIDKHERTHEDPYFGWLVTGLSRRLYPSTMSLKTHVHMKEPKLRPWVELEPTDHPLAVEQRDGITWDRVREIAAIMLHPE